MHTAILNTTSKIQAHTIDNQNNSAIVTVKNNCGLII